MRLHLFALSIALFASPTLLLAQEVPATSIGRVRAAFAEPFSRVGAVREEPDGRVLVLDAIENRLLRVDFRTASAVAIGRQGSGPGEYTLLMGLVALAADTTLAVDMRGGGQALVVVARGASSERIRAPGVAQGDPLFFRPDVQSDARGNLYEQVMRTSLADREAGNAGVRRLDRVTGRQDTIGRVSQRMRSPLAQPISSRPTSSTAPSPRRPTPPYATSDQWAVAPDGRIAIVTVDPYRVHMIDPSGRQVEGPELPYRRVPMSDALKAEWRELQEQPVPTLQFGPGRELTAGLTRRPYQEPAEWPDVLPPFLNRALRFSPDGMLWVERAGPAGSGQMFDVIDVRGQLARRVTLPSDLRLVGFGRDGVYTVRRDEDDFEFLQLHELLP